MKKVTLLAFAFLLLPVFTFAAVNATSGTITSPVAPNASVASSLSVSLSNGDDWRSTKVAVSVPGPNNDIEVCVNTTDHTTNGTFTENFSFNAPGVDDNYVAFFTAYENANCTGEDDTVSKNFTVTTPPPPPVDVCPLVNGNQAAGPCADTLCVAPAAWDVGTQSCVVPPPPPPVDVCPLVNGNQAAGPCADTLCVAPDAWDVGVQSCVAPAPAPVVETPKPTGGTQPWCSSPTAPGWRVDLPGGGCGTQGSSLAASAGFFPIFFKAGETIKDWFGKTHVCPFWFFSGCVLK